MNSIILNIADSVDMGTVYNQLRMLDPNVRIAKTNIDIEKAEDESQKPTAASTKTDWSKKRSIHRSNDKIIIPQESGRLMPKMGLNLKHMYETNAYSRYTVENHQTTSNRLLRIMAVSLRVTFTTLIRYQSANGEHAPWYHPRIIWRCPVSHTVQELAITP